MKNIKESKQESTNKYRTYKGWCDTYTHVLICLIQNTISCPHPHFVKILQIYYTRVDLLQSTGLCSCALHLAWSLL